MYNPTSSAAALVLASFVVSAYSRFLQCSLRTDIHAYVLAPALEV
jgi:hypothetical protein